MPLRLRPSSFSEGWKGVRDSALAAPNGLEDKHLTRSTLHSPRAPQTVPDERRPRLSGLRILEYLYKVEINTWQYHEVVPLSAMILTFAS